MSRTDKQYTNLIRKYTQVTTFVRIVKNRKRWRSLFFIPLHPSTAKTGRDNKLNRREAVNSFIRQETTVWDS